MNPPAFDTRYVDGTRYHTECVCLGKLTTSVILWLTSVPQPELISTPSSWGFVTAAMTALYTKATMKQRRAGARMRLEARTKEGTLSN
jgi:hypothetical protein